jgi:creatinine amidohydrolase
VSAGVSARVQFADLTSPEIDALRSGQKPVPVLLLPVGAVEPHGPHAPLDTDSIISTSLCDRVASAFATDLAIRVLVMPAIRYGVTRYAAAFAGAVSISDATLEGLVTDVCTSVRAQGFPHVIIVNSHFEPEHVHALRRAADRSSAALFDLTRPRAAERLSEEFRSGAAHAGQYETSLVLAAQPELVDVERMRRLTERPVDMPAAIASGKTDFLAMGMDQAYCGNPAGASGEEGEGTLTTLSAMLSEVIRDRLAG